MVLGQIAALIAVIISAILVCLYLKKRSEVVIKKVSDSDAMTGIRFYRPMLYLLVAVDKDGKVTATVVPLPDKDKQYEISVTKGWSKVELKATLEGGWNLTSLGATIESQVPAMVTAMGGLVGAVAGVTGVAGEYDKPGLYLIDLEHTDRTPMNLLSALKI